MASVSLGNVSHTAIITDTETGVKIRYKSTHIEQSVTQVNNLPDGVYAALTAIINLWRHESDMPPAWVFSDSPLLEAVLMDHFGCGPKPDEWEIKISGPPSMVPVTVVEVPEGMDIDEMNRQLASQLPLEQSAPSVLASAHLSAPAVDTPPPPSPDLPPPSEEPAP